MSAGGAFAFEDPRFWSEEAWRFGAGDNRRFCEQANPLWTCAADPSSCPGAFISYHRDRVEKAQAEEVKARGGGG